VSVEALQPATACVDQTRASAASSPAPVLQRVLRPVLEYLPAASVLWSVKEVGMAVK